MVLGAIDGKYLWLMDSADPTVVYELEVCPTES